MKYFHKIRINALPRIPNGREPHWAVVNKDRKNWHKWVGDQFLMNRPSAPLQACHVWVCRGSSSQPDYDNLVASFKPVIDALKVNKIISDDKDLVILQRQYTWTKAKAGKGFIELSIQEV
jgi:Holliday junction resolvase RusA-like endonuclease